MSTLCTVLQERLYYYTTIHNLQIYLYKILQNFVRLVWKTTNPLLNCGSSREQILLRQCSQTACFEWFSLKNTRFFPLTSNIKIIQGFKAILLQHQFLTLTFPMTLTSLLLMLDSLVKKTYQDFFKVNFKQKIPIYYCILH